MFEGWDSGFGGWSGGGLSNSIGTIQGALELNATQFLAGIRSAINAVDQFARNSQQNTQQLNVLERRLQSMGNTFDNVGGLIRKAAAAFTIFKIAEFAKDAALAAARYETMGVVLNQVGATAGYSANQLDLVTESLQKNGISMIASRESATRMIQAQLDLSKATQLARIAQDAAVIGNINSSEAFQRLVYGIQSAQVEMLRTIGINVNFENSYAALAKELGKNSKELTEIEKAQARMNVVIEAGAKIAGTYEAAMTTAGKKLTSFTRYVEDFKVKLGQAFGPALVRIVDEATEAMKRLQDSVANPETQRQLEDMAAQAVRAFELIVRVGTEAAQLFNVVAKGWTSLPPIIQDLGIVGALIGGAKARVAILLLSTAIGLAVDGYNKLNKSFNDAKTIDEVNASIKKQEQYIKDLNVQLAAEVVHNEILNEQGKKDAGREQRIATIRDKIRIAEATRAESDAKIKLIQIEDAYNEELAKANELGQDAVFASIKIVQQDKKTIASKKDVEKELRRVAQAEEDLADIRNNYDEAVKEASRYGQEFVQQLEEQERAVNDFIEALERRVNLGNLDEAAAALQRVKYEIEEIKKQFPNASSEKIDIIVRLKYEELAKDLDNIVKQNQEAAGKAEEFWKEFAGNVERTFEGVFSDLLDGQSNLLETFVDLFKKAIAHLAAYALTHKIVLPIATQLFGGGSELNNVTSSLFGGGGNMPGGGILNNLLSSGASSFSNPYSVGSAIGFNQGIITGGAEAPFSLGSYASNSVVGGSSSFLGAASAALPYIGAFSAGALGGYQKGGIGGALLSGALSTGGYIGGGALASALSGTALGATFGSAFPVVGTAIGALVGTLLSGVLFNDRPQPEFGTYGQIPGDFQSFLNASPTDLLSVTKMNKDARASAGVDQSSVQESYDRITSGFQSLFKGIYDSLPDSIQEAWDSIDFGEFTHDPRVSKRKTTALAIADHLKQWVMGLDDNLTSGLIDATASVFAQGAGFGGAAGQGDVASKIGDYWKGKLSSYIDPLMDAAKSAEEVEQVIAQYTEYVQAFFNGLSNISTYMSADMFKDVSDALNSTSFDNFTNALKGVDTQIEFITDSLDMLTGQDYANAIQQIGQLLSERYQLELQYLAQLKSRQKELFDSLDQMDFGFMWDTMDQNQQLAYAEQQATTAWKRIFNSTTVDAAEYWTQQWQKWEQQWWDLGGQVNGAEWQEQNLPAFLGDTKTVTQFLADQFELAFQDIQSSHDEMGEATAAAVGNIEDLTGSVGNANTELTSFGDSIYRANMAIQDMESAISNFTNTANAARANLPSEVNA